MYGTLYNYNPQSNIDRINAQINELEKMKNQIPQQVPTNLTQNFQLAPQNREIVRYANSIDDVQREMVIGETPYFSKDMSVVWIKNQKGDIRTFELKEIVPKDEKDIKIELLQAQIEELLKKGMSNNEHNGNVNESVKDEESTDVSDGGESKTKPKQSNGNAKKCN